MWSRHWHKTDNVNSSLILVDKPGHSPSLQAYLSVNTIFFRLVFACMCVCVCVSGNYIPHPAKLFKMSKIQNNTKSPGSLPINRHQRWTIPRRMSPTIFGSSGDLSSVSNLSGIISRRVFFAEGNSVISPRLRNKAKHLHGSNILDNWLRSASIRHRVNTDSEIICLLIRYLQVSFVPKNTLASISGIRQKKNK